MFINHTDTWEKYFIFLSIIHKATDWHSPTQHVFEDTNSAHRKQCCATWQKEELYKAKFWQSTCMSKVSLHVLSQLERVTGNLKTSDLLSFVFRHFPSFFFGLLFFFCACLSLYVCVGRLRKVWRPAFCENNVSARATVHLCPAAPYRRASFSRHFKRFINSEATHLTIPLRCVLRNPTHPYHTRNTTLFLY